MVNDPLRESLRNAQRTRRQVLRDFTFAGLALTAPAALAACGSSSKSSTSSKDTAAALDHFTWGDPELTTLNPVKGFGTASIVMMEPILKYDAKSNLLGNLAEKWRAVDARTFVYTLRPGVKFWDGSPMTVDDLAFSMSVHKDPKSGSTVAGYIPPLEFIKATSDTEVTVKLVKPNATWTFVPIFMPVLKRTYYERLGKDYGAPSKGAAGVMGTGPYKLTVFKVSERVEMVPYPEYWGWGDKPRFKQLAVKVIRDAETRLLAARQGDIEGTEISGDDIDRWKELSGWRVVSKASRNFSFFSFDTQEQPWDDVHVRRMVAHSVDYQGIIKTVFKGYAGLAESMVPRAAIAGLLQGQALEDAYASLPKYDFDLDKARDELAQSKYADGFKASVWYYGSGTSEAICLTLQQNLSKLGIDLKLEAVDDDTGIEREDQHKDLGFSYLGWGASNDPIEMPMTVLLSSAAKVGGYNEANYKNPKVDALIEENITSTDNDVRARTLVEIMKIAAEDVPYVPLFTQVNSIATKDAYKYVGYNPSAGPESFVDKVRLAA